MRQPGLSIRICVGAHHQPDCHHRQYMRQGVEEFLASERVRLALRNAVCQPMPDAAPDIEAERVLSWLVDAVEWRP